jgi:hypothetical protein
VHVDTPDQLAVSFFSYPPILLSSYPPILLFHDKETDHFLLILSFVFTFQQNTPAGCSPGYSRSGISECAPCMELGSAIAMVSIGLIFGVVIYSLLILSTMNNYGALTREGLIARVIASNVLIVSMFKDLEIKWPSFLKTAMSAGSVAGDPVALLNLECLLVSDGPDTIPFVILKSLVSLLIPILIAMFLGVIFGTKEILGRISWRKKMKKQSHGDMFESTLSVAMAKRFKKGLEASKQRTQDGTTKKIGDQEFGGEGLIGFSSVVSSKVMFQGSLVIMACKFLNVGAGF